MKVQELLEGATYGKPYYDEKRGTILGGQKQWLESIGATKDDVKAAIAEFKKSAVFKKAEKAGLIYNATKKEEANGTLSFAQAGFKDIYNIYANGQIRTYNSSGNWLGVDPKTRITRLKSPKPKLVAGDAVKSIISTYTQALEEVLAKFKKKSKVTEDVEQLDEAKARRAWNNRLKKIDELMWWLYDKGILTKTEQKKKDSVFHQYYRYYNDGDMPAALKTKGYSKWDPDAKVEEALEEYLEGFIKQILGKYLPKIDRAEFRTDILIKNMKVVKDVADRNDAYSLLTYWLKKIKISDADGSLKAKVDALQKSYDAAKTAFDKAHPATSNTVMSYRKDKMVDAGVWDKSFDKLWDAVVKDCAEIGNFVQNIIDGAEKLKKEMAK